MFKVIITCAKFKSDVIVVNDVLWRCLKDAAEVLGFSEHEVSFDSRGRVLKDNEHLATIMIYYNDELIL